MEAIPFTTNTQTFTSFISSGISTITAIALRALRSINLLSLAAGVTIFSYDAYQNWAPFTHKIKLAKAYLLLQSNDLVGVLNSLTSLKDSDDKKELIFKLAELYIASGFEATALSLAENPLHFEQLLRLAKKIKNPGMVDSLLRKAKESILQNPFMNLQMLMNTSVELNQFAIARECLDPMKTLISSSSPIEKLMDFCWLARLSSKINHQEKAKEYLYLAKSSLSELSHDPIPGHLLVALNFYNLNLTNEAPEILEPIKNFLKNTDKPLDEKELDLIGRCCSFIGQVEYNRGDWFREIVTRKLGRDRNINECALHGCLNFARIYRTLGLTQDAQVAAKHAHQKMEAPNSDMLKEIISFFPPDDIPEYLLKDLETLGEWGYLYHLYKKVKPSELPNLFQRYLISLNQLTPIDTFTKLLYSPFRKESLDEAKKLLPALSTAEKIKFLPKLAKAYLSIDSQVSLQLFAGSQKMTHRRIVSSTALKIVGIAAMAFAFQLSFNRLHL